MYVASEEVKSYQFAFQGLSMGAEEPYQGSSPLPCRGPGRLNT